MISFQIDFSILVDLIAKENELNKNAMIGYLSQFKSNNNKNIYNNNE